MADELEENIDVEEEEEEIIDPPDIDSKYRRWYLSGTPSKKMSILKK